MPFSDVLKARLREPAWVAAAVALAVRAAASAQAYAQNPIVSRPQLDGMYYMQWAQEIAAGDLVGRGGLVGGAPLFLNPLYAYVLAPLAALLGDGLVPGVLVLQAVMGAGTAWLAAGAAERLFGRTAAWVAGLAVALSAALVHLDGHLSVSGLGAFVAAGAVFAAAPRRDGEPAGRLGGAHGPLAAGAWLGFGALARPIAPLAVPFFAWLFARRAGEGRRLRAAAVVVLAFLGPAVVSFARNATVGGEAVVYTAASGANVYLGNNPTAWRLHVMTSGGRFRFNPFEMHADIRRDLAPRVPLDASWGERSSALWDDALEAAADDPGTAFTYLVHKARWCLAPFEPASSASFDLDRRLAPLLHLAVVPTWIVGALGLLGLLLHLRRLDVVCGAGAIVLAHGAVLTLVFPLSHYRSPAIPALAVLAGGAVAWGVAAWRAGRRGPVAAGVLTVLGLAALGALPPQPARQIHTGMYTLAACLRDAERFDEAEAWVERAAEAQRAAGRDERLEPLYWIILGDVRFARDGDFGGALTAYRRYLEREPHDTGIRLNVVFCLMALDRWSEALAELQELVRRDPVAEDDPQVLSRFAEALTRVGRGREARDYVIRALRHRSPDPAARPRDWAIPPDLR